MRCVIKLEIFLNDNTVAKNVERNGWFLLQLQTKSLREKNCCNCKDKKSITTGTAKKNSLP